HWLRQAVALTPLSAWPVLLQETPADLVTLAGTSEWSRAMFEGWAEAAMLQGDEDWAVLLLGTEIAESEGARALVASLSPGRPAEAVVGICERVPDKLADWVQLAPAPWSLAFSARVLELLFARVSTPGLRSVEPALRAAFVTAGLRADPRVIPDVETTS